MTPSRIAELKQLASGTTCWVGVTLFHELIAEVERLQEQRTHHSTLTLMEHERTKSQLASAMEEIRRLTKPDLKTQFPTVFHPNHLRDPDVGHIVQAALQNGTAMLSEPMCLECAGYADKLASAREVIEFYERQSYYPDCGDEARAWLKANP